MTADEDAHHQCPPGRWDDPPPLKGATVGKGEASYDECRQVPHNQVETDANTKHEYRVGHQDAPVARVLLGDEPDLTQALLLTDEPETDQIAANTLELARDKPCTVASRLRLVGDLEESLDDLSNSLTAMEKVHALGVDGIGQRDWPTHHSQIWNRIVVHCR